MQAEYNNALEQAELAYKSDLYENYVRLVIIANINNHVWNNISHDCNTLSLR